MTIRATDDPIARYYELHPDEWEEDNDVANASAHTQLMLYLVSVLNRYYRAQHWLIIPELAMQHWNRPHERPITPDIAVFLGTVLPDGVNVSGWIVGQPDRPAPDVVFEIASESTWDEDIRRKPQKYARLGVAEYYSYDPYTPQVWRPSDKRLRGWHNMSGQMGEIHPNLDGSLWSPKLQSRLVPDERLLRLTDIYGVRRPSEMEAEIVAQQEAQRATELQRQAEAREAQAVLAANIAQAAREEAERQVIEAERKANARDAKLREMGIDPDSV